MYASYAMYISRKATKLKQKNAFHVDTQVCDGFKQYHMQGMDDLAPAEVPPQTDSQTDK